ncbi:MAG TPA: hypothetical protein VK427_09815 [Kofleriaceae bacterium]|nr:hypothetical protein [Kofleriaceae bacterium]
MNTDLVELTKNPLVDHEPEDTVADDDDPFVDWNEEQVHVATGSQPDALPTTSRTQTLADPLTTGLLAEVARRTTTMEFDPSGVEMGFDQRNTQEIDPELLAEALRTAEPAPVEPVHANTLRRPK